MNFVKDVLRGILIGIANVIPGVSGGTMMVSMGIYDKIIGAINNLFKKFKESIKTVLPYFIGMAVGILGFSFCIEYLFDHFPLPTAMAFIGLILGGVPVVAGRVKGKKADAKEIVFFIIFFLFIIIMQKFDVIMGHFVNVGTHDALNVFNIIMLLIMGTIAAAAMVIPGVSGSLMLMAFGYYDTVIENINSFVRSVVNLDIQAALHSAGFLIPFGVGVIVGIFAVARLIEFLLKKHERITIFSILGLITASPFAVIMSIGVGNITVLSVIAALAAFAAGFICALKLGRE